MPSAVRTLLFSPLLSLTLAALPAPASSPDPWQPLGFSGGGAMFSPAISPADPDLMLLNCDMSAAYLSQDGGHNWHMLNYTELRGDTRIGFI